MLIDTHCHLDFSSFDGDRHDIILRALDGGVERMIVPATDIQSANTALALAGQYRELYCAIGVHPTSLPSPGGDQQIINELTTLAAENKVCAIGEIGLDYHWMKTPKDHQIDWFKEQIAIADQLNLPIIIHNRDASADVLAILSEQSCRRNRAIGISPLGVLHSFSGDRTLADAAIHLGYKIGISGVITYKNNNAELRSIAEEISTDSYVIETDAPFLAPVPYRGKRNEPAFVVHVAEEIAALRNLSFEQVAHATTANALSLFPRVMNS